MSEPKFVDEMRAYIRRHVVAGFHSPSTVTESALEVFVDEADQDVLRPIAERLTKDIAAAYFQEQACWPSLTDCDRLDDAFQELEAAGIVVRQNFSCCGNCGVYELGREIEAERESGQHVRGYTFYHMQDAENAAEGVGLYLHYGSADGERCATLEIGREVAATLERHGLATTWNGRIDTRIFVKLDWKRRLEVTDRPASYRGG